MISRKNGCYLKNAAAVKRRRGSMDQLKKEHAMKFAWIQRCWIMTGLILLGGCFLALRSKNRLLTDVAVYLGCMMLFTGCMNIFVYYKNKEILHGARWMLADGLSTALLSFFPLFNKMIIPAVLPLFFGTWELFSGILKTVDAGELKEDRTRGWRGFLSIGILEILSGIASLMKPVEDFVGMRLVIASIMLIQSSGYFYKVGMYPGLVKEAGSNRA